MHSTLEKPWGKYPEGTKVTTEPGGDTAGALRVNDRRFEALREGGFFISPAAAPSPPPIPKLEETLVAERSWDRAQGPAGVVAAAPAPAITKKEGT